MAKHNFGVIKATFTNYLNESENLHAKEQFGKFMKMIKESATLRSIFEVYKNLEEKYIPSETLAIKYIDENINKLNGSISQQSFIKATNSIQSLLEGLNVKVSNGKKELYEHINTLISESLNESGKDVNKIHESFSYLIEYIKENKPKLSESILIGYSQIPKEFMIRRAVEKFNERYSSINESDKEVLKSIISTDNSVKQSVFESLKLKTIDTLKTLIESDTNKENIEMMVESTNRLSEMKFSRETFTDDILKLNELRMSIITQ
jgi:hypothetical protein